MTLKEFFVKKLQLSRGSKLDGGGVSSSTCVTSSSQSFKSTERQNFYPDLSKLVKNSDRDTVIKNNIYILLCFSIKFC